MSIKIKKNTQEKIMKYTIKYPLTIVTPEDNEMCKYSMWIPCKCKKCKYE
tara:strand:- start:401 stop:550 length:150 start_codon:yes stop_codon:yes gene_type:complete